MTARAIAVPATMMLALLAALAIWLLSGTVKVESELLRPGDEQVVAAGAAVYEANCASCHGSDLKGEPNWQTPGEDGLMPAPPHDETGHTWHHPDEILFAITKHGVAKAANLEDYQSAMPVYGDILTDEEIIAALSWIKAQWPQEIRQRHDEMNAQYQALEKDAYQ